MTVSLRRMPAPYASMLAISNDIDGTSIHRFRALHRYLNSTAETPMGQGLGLDIANSMWMYEVRPQILKSGRSMAYWMAGDPTQKTPYADEIIAYAKAGWIDTLHTYGNFSGGARNGHGFARSYAEAALEELIRHDVRLDVWTNHGDAQNTQCVGREDFMHGAIAGSDSYHTDLLVDYGARFFNTDKHHATWGHAHPLTRFRLADKQLVQVFPRFATQKNYTEIVHEALSAGLRAGYDSLDRPFAAVWSTNLIDYQLSKENLDQAVQDESFVIAAQHLGTQTPMLTLDARSMNAFRRLAEYQARGDILVASTSRLLNYADARENLEWSIRDESGTVWVDIASDRAGAGLKDFRGLTFSGSAELQIAINGKPLPEAEIVRTVAANESSTGIRWHDICTDDVTAEHRDRRQYFDVPGAPMPEPGEVADGRADAGRLALDPLNELGFTGGRRAVFIGADQAPVVRRLMAGNAQIVSLISHSPSDAVGRRDFSEAKFPIEDGASDSVFVDEGFAAADIEALLTELSRMLAIRGIAYLSVPTLYQKIALIDEALQQSVQMDRARALVNELHLDRLASLGVARTGGAHGRSYQKLNVQYAAYYAGFEALGSPISNAPAWRGIPKTVDFAFKKVEDRTRRTERALNRCATWLNKIELARGMAEKGAPSTATLLFDLAEFDFDAARPRQTRERMYCHLLAGDRRVLKRHEAMFETDRTAEASFVRACYQLGRKDFAAARQQIEAIQERTARQSFVLAVAATRLGDFEAAREEIAQGLAARPDHLDLHVARLELSATEADEQAFKRSLEEFIEVAERQAGEWVSLVLAD